MHSADDIAKSTLKSILLIFPDEKLAKQVHNAAKRISNPKKRVATSSVANNSPITKRRRSGTTAENRTSQKDTEAELALPTTQTPETELLGVVIQTNRAPLVLAFAVILLKYTMPEQPLSSRLSLAQAVVSVNSQSKARSIGLESGKSAEDEGWGKGQPKVRVMGREIAVMRRGRYAVGEKVEEEDGQETVDRITDNEQDHTSYWGLDLEALRKSNGPLIVGENANGRAGLPIYSAQAAKNYVSRSFAVTETERNPEKANVKTESSSGQKKLTAAQVLAKKEEAAAMLLKTIDMLFESWTTTLGKEDLDRKAWSWYLQVRPDVAQGQAGWGQRGHVKLEDILNLRRTT